MDLERAAMIGQKTEKELAAKGLGIRAAGLRDSLRLLLLPTSPVDALDDEQIASQGLALAQVLIDLRAVRAEIAAINRHLGG
ncbi:hypothetical protein DFW101_0331 [Solidesulfovibrio carbinoliphilus subsp. oakridgensis]|uniref:Uncharacterized protein n=1 Tax=Solidesulfovibrio carbinoliphilus subsp. oakridgensis TaxID=694327 RepID=G7QD42_9BACT|nr:hypothetical protein [Solidesulfovibrio carbinoliphilus]EHJ46348.1 hypothetical protein DFW101_0331 [Solidesulfovibrio carbinoliphilus subsp. oakridgensis]